MKTWSHDCWRMRKSIIGRTAWRGGWKVITSVITSPNRNAYALVFEDGDIYDMTTYDYVEIR